MSIASDADKQQRTKRWEMLGLFAIFLGPVLIAWYIYNVNPSLIPSERSNYGTIINPARPLPELSFEPLNNSNKLSTSSLRGKWTFVSVSRSACGENCRHNMYKMRQLRIAVGKEMERVQRLVILVDSKELKQFEEILQRDYSGTLVATGPSGSISKFLAVLDPSGEAAIDHMYIIDPLGNLMMHYLPGADGAGMVSDMEKLLKISQIG